MEILKMIQLHEDNSRKVIYDFSTGRYYQNYEREKSSGANYWLLLQPFVIVGVEAVQRWLMQYSLGARKMGGIILFVIGACICIAAWEFYLSKASEKLRNTMREIKQPDPKTLDRWAQDFPRRLKNAGKIGLFGGILIFLFLVLFLYTGIPLMLTLALACFCVAYFFLSSARPLLLRRYMKKYKEL